MSRTLPLLSAALLTAFAASSALAQAPAPPAAGPADGITMEMMPISADQIKTCRDQASSQLATEQDTLHKREHGQDNDKMKQGAVTGITGAATSAISRGRGGYWWGGNNNGANTAAATGATQRTDRNSQAVASTTGIGQDVGKDAYSQCVAGIKGPEYVHFRQSGKIVAFTGSAPESAPTPAIAAAATPAPLPSAASPVQDLGDGKHFLLTAPGQTDAREVTALPNMKNAFVEEVTGDKYFVLPDGSVRRVAKSGGPKTASK